MRWVAGALLLASALTSREARAQVAPITQPWLDVGSASIGQASSASRLMASIGGGFWHQRRRVALIGDGAIALTRDSSGAMQLNARAIYTPWRWLRAEADASRLAGSGNTSAQMLAGRTAWIVNRFTFDAQAGQSRSTRGRNDFFGNTVTVGAVYTAGPFSWRATATRAHTNDFVLMEASGFTLTRLAASYALDDIGTELAWRTPTWSLGANQFQRRSREATIGRANSRGIVATRAVSPAWTLVLQGGTQLADILRGIPQARYTGVSVRWTPVPHAKRGAIVRPSPAADGVSVRNGEVALIHGAPGATLELTIDADSNAVVEVTSSANDWGVVRVARVGDRFVHRLSLPSGAHKVALRVNGAPWRAPRGLTSVRDDFGGSAGVVVVP